MSQTNDQKSIKEEIIDLDKSEFKKKSNFLRNFLFFFVYKSGIKKKENITYECMEIIKLINRMIIRFIVIIYYF